MVTIEIYNLACYRLSAMNCLEHCFSFTWNAVWLIWLITWLLNCVKLGNYYSETFHRGHANCVVLFQIGNTITNVDTGVLIDVWRTTQTYEQTIIRSGPKTSGSSSKEGIHRSLIWTWSQTNYRMLLWSS